MSAEEFFEISADTVTVEVTDAKTGETFRRELPIDYYENANFLRLRAEDFSGAVSELVFCSGRGVERMKDMTGRGPDHDRCGGHGGKYARCTKRFYHTVYKNTGGSVYDQKDTRYQRRDPESDPER